MSTFESLPVLLLLLLVTISSGSLVAAQATPDSVRDTGGNELIAGNQYHILPAYKSKSYGGLGSRPRNGVSTCPFNIWQTGAPWDRGVFAKFAPVDGSKLIRLSTDLNVQFNESNHCPEKPIWTLAAMDPATGQRFVTYGGVLGNPGPATANNWFRIERDRKHYKFSFCPGVCQTCRLPCGDLGLYSEYRWFVLGGTPFTVKFRKA